MVVISKTDILEQLEKIERTLIRKDNPPIRKIINEETKKMERPVKKFLTYMGNRIAYDILSFVYRRPGIKEPVIKATNPISEDFLTSIDYVDWELIEKDGAREIIQPATLNVYNRSAETAHKMLKIEGSFDVFDPNSVEWAKDRSATMVTNVVNETKMAVRALVGEAMEQHYTVRQLAKVLKDRAPNLGLNLRQQTALINYENKLRKKGYNFDQINKKANRYQKTLFNDRVKMISRTETSAAANEGYLNELNNQDYFQEVQHTVGPNPCEECQALAGEIYRIEEAHGKIPVHPNCVCTWVTVTPKHREPRHDKPVQSQVEEQSVEWKPTMTQEEAERWAKDSKYGNERFYHGTSQSSANLINDKGFDIDYIRKHNPNGKANGIGHYFTTDKGYASAYAESKQSVLEVVTNIKNPIPLKEYNEIKRTAYDLSAILGHFKDKPYRAVLKELKDMGYEGFVKAMENITAKQYKEYIGLSKTAKNSVELKDLIQLNNMLDKGYDSIRFGEQANLLVVFDDKVITVVK